MRGERKQHQDRVKIDSWPGYKSFLCPNKKRPSQKLTGAAESA